MKNQLVYLRFLFLLGFIAVSISSFAQLPCKVLVGYYQSSWGTNIRLKDVNSNYNVICLAFFEANGGDGNYANNTVSNLSFLCQAKQFFDG